MDYIKDIFNTVFEWFSTYSFSDLFGGNGDFGLGNLWDELILRIAEVFK